MDDEPIRIATCLRLGAPLCYPHKCCHCGTDVDSSGKHGLSCRWSEERRLRHAAINDMVYRFLRSAGVSSQLQHSGLYRSDGRRPDGITVVPWKNRKCLVWDVTCLDMYAPSYHAEAT